MRLRFLFIALTFFSIGNSNAQKSSDYVVKTPVLGGFPLISEGKVPDLLLSENDYQGIFRVAEDLQIDFEKVSGTKPEILTSPKSAKTLIIVGTLGQSEIIDQLAKSGKIDSVSLAGKWEKFTTQIVKNPMEGVEQALVIAGSDKRGTIYGMYDLSRQMGVSPWYYWADVPVEKQSVLYVKPGVHTNGEPKVKYRGIFLNDEMPALGGWANENFGGFTSGFYEHVFELILRLNGNYLWPAMWGRMFYVDDPKNGPLADEYGIVMGTSHHEPLTRAQTEWKESKGAWDFSTNADTLKKFWRGGVERMGNTDALVTIGMRGDGDEPMTEGTAIDLLENIVSAQREIIAEVTGKPAERTPQIWALYKEVQDYYDQGMRVPDDVTLLFADDNWGNIRKLPELDAAPRKGGYGIYYHFDYVGGPRNYKWINTTQIERVWEQMHLAYESGVDKVWIVNVGDLKPMEFPISFFLDYAWDPDGIDASTLPDYYENWAFHTFNGQKTTEIADILKKYTKYNSRRKPELIDTTTYSLTNYNEADRVVASYVSLAAKANKVGDQLPKEYQDAYYELVLFPVLASANLNEMYVAAAKNHWYASQGRAATNQYAEKVKELFEKDAELTEFYNKELAGGKWNHMMDQTHIGYTYWQQPEKNTMPKVDRLILPDTAELGVSVEESEKWWPESKDEAQLPIFYDFNDQKHNITVFNRGQKTLDFTLKSTEKWLILPEKRQKTKIQTEIPVAIDWYQAPEGKSKGEIIISSRKDKVSVRVFIGKRNGKNTEGFQEQNGYISISAVDFSAKKTENDFNWVIIDNLGKTGSSITPMPVFVAPKEITSTSPRLEYTINLETAGTVKVHAYFSPTLNYTTRDGLKYGISIDDEKPQIINIHTDKTASNWNKSVADNINILTTEHRILKAGKHTLNYFMVDGGVVLQKIVIDTGGLKETYLGPPESK